MPMSRHLIAFALVLLLPACATTGAARTASPATASASTSPPAAPPHDPQLHAAPRSEEQTSELQSLMRISYAAFCLKKKNTCNNSHTAQTQKKIQSEPKEQ